MTKAGSLLNLACGSRYHADWVNVDLVSQHDGVQAFDLRHGIPFPDNTFAGVYHSHFLEHLRRSEALEFLLECHRVLRPGGVIRVATPDLEQIARQYLHALEKASHGEAGWQHHYDWMMLELYDQTVREKSGGAMLEYLRQTSIPNEAFVLERMGGEAQAILGGARLKGPVSKTPRRRRLQRIARRLPRYVWSQLVSKLLTKEQNRALQIGQFRLQGEVHQWMYDHYSLARLLERVGFQNPTRLTAGQSAIGNWTAYCLDTEPDGSVYKPDSLYMEALKPLDRALERL